MVYSDLPVDKVQAICISILMFSKRFGLFITAKCSYKLKSGSIYSWDNINAAPDDKKQLKMKQIIQHVKPIKLKLRPVLELLASCWTTFCRSLIALVVDELFDMQFETIAAETVWLLFTTLAFPPTEPTDIF